MRYPALTAILAAILCPVTAWGKMHSVSIPLDDGRLSLRAMADCINQDLPLSLAIGSPKSDLSIDFSGLRGWVLVRAVNAAGGESFHIAVGDEAITVSFDPEKIPDDWNQFCAVLIRFTEIAAPEATARQYARQGLLLPAIIDPAKPLVILVHGMDGDAGSCMALRDLLEAEGKQTAIFAYPCERPLDEISQYLTDNMVRLHSRFPRLQIDFVTQSMGGLVVRDYVEGPSYVGGVRRLIMIAPPNSGSTWARLAILSKLLVNANNAVSDSEWSPSWMITEGICQAANDLEPNSQFLNELNSHTRRPGVDYTIIAGDRPVFFRFESDFLSGVARAVPTDWWALRAVRDELKNDSQSLLATSSIGDGPVDLASAELPGVHDFVVVHADHVELYQGVDGHAPAAWSAIQKRLRD
jgi:hypothetical protein